MAYFPTNVLDNQIKALPTVKAISNQAVASFDTDIADRLVSCVCDIPSGKSEINVVGCGKNMIGFPNVDFTISNMRFYSDGSAIILNGTSSGEIASINANFKNYLAFTLPAGDYYGSANWPSRVGIYLRKYSDNTMISNNTDSFTFTLSEPTKVFWGLYVANNKALSDHNTQFNITKGTTPTAYSAFNGTTYNIPFGETLTDTATYNTVTGVLTRNDTTTKQLNSCPIITLDNEVNNIYNDCGNTSLDYQITIGASL